MLQVGELMSLYRKMRAGLDFCNKVLQIEASDVYLSRVKYKHLHSAVTLSDQDKGIAVDQAFAYSFVQQVKKMISVENKQLFRSQRALKKADIQKAKAEGSTASCNKPPTQTHKCVSGLYLTHLGTLVFV